VKRYSPFVVIALSLIIVSTSTYLIHYFIFHDSHHIFIFMLHDFAFLPIEVLLVVIIIERVLANREKQAILQKLNMVVGAFFSEVGTRLLGELLGCFDSSETIRSRFGVTKDWESNDFKKAVAAASNLKGKTDCRNIDLEELKALLVQKRPFLLSLLENPNVLEYERFTDLLWALFHLDEELEARTSLKDLPERDLEHISVDIQRVYGNLISQWLAYVEHLRNNYPYLYSLVLRTHPLNEDSSPVVT
jgi:hypothetical protein